MIGSIALILGLFALGAKADYALVWEDEFNGTTLSDADWLYQTGCDGWGNNELECYTEKRKENVYTTNGVLTIHVVVEAYQGKQYTSARLNSRKAWAYGKYEAKAKMPKGKHFWPAIWMMPQDSKYGGWAASGEIDIMEYRGESANITQGTIHYGGSWPNNKWSGSGEKTFPFDLSADFHTYGIEWDTKEFRWYVDEKQYHAESIDKSMWSGKGTNPYTKNGQPFDQPFHWILNVAVGGNFFGNSPQLTVAEAKAWPKPTMEIDYVRVYQQK